MSNASGVFRESNLFAEPIRALGLSIEQTALAPVLADFRAELAAKGIKRLAPKFYLST